MRGIALSVALPVFAAEDVASSPKDGEKNRFS